MRDRPRHIGRLCQIGLLGGIALLAGGNTASDTFTVKVTATDLRNSKGVVRACLTSTVKQFPKCSGDADYQSIVVPAKAQVTLSFKGVKPGRYAIALLHDENNNGKADRALMLMPKEGFGFSRDAKVTMGPPKFNAAAFDVTSTDQTQVIRMRYML
ncbi:MAG: DUF2141 domain-containing protein [Pontixanthobacter sp.]